MYRLKTLGGIDLRADDGTPQRELLAQPKRVALLTILAVEAGGYVRRDSLLALLWPDLDTDRARHALRQTVYLLRRALGPEVIASRGEEDLGVDPALLWCDAAVFMALVQTGKAEEALGQYGGEFLPGFHLPGAAEEFEDWLAARRRHYQGAAISGALAVVEEHRRAQELARATEVARWAAAQDPLNELVHRELIRLLGDRGDAAGARRVYNAFAERLQRDLGSTPTAGTRELLARAEPPPAPIAVVPTITPPVPPPEVRASPETAPATRGARWRGWAIGALGLVVLTGGWLARRTNSGTTPPALAVGDIRQVPEPRDSADQLPIVDLLATSLARLPGSQVLSAARLTEIRQALTRDGEAASAAAIARKAGARELLEGSVYRVGADSLVLELRRVDLQTGRVVQGYRVGAREVFALVDRLTDEFARVARVTRPSGSIADVTTGSLVAFRLYQEGLRSYYASDIRVARRFFQSAVDEDSSFALATWYLARTEQVLNLGLTWTHFLAALRLAGQASEQERLRITADVLAQDSRYAAIAVAETLSSRYPLDPDGALTLGKLMTGRDYTRAQSLLRKTIVLDSALEAHAGPTCRQCEAYETLVALELSTDSLERALAISREFVTRIPDSPQAWQIRAGVLWQAGDSAGAHLAEARYSALLPGVGPRPGVSASTLAHIARGSYRIAEQELLALDRTNEGVRGEARWFLGIVLRNEGRLEEARALALGGRHLPAAWTGLGEATDSIGLLLADLERGAPATCIAYTRGVLNRIDPWSRTNWPGQTSREVAWALGRRAMCEAAGGDTTGLARIADSLVRVTAGSGFVRDQRLHHYATGLLLRARGRPEEAIAAFRAAISSPTWGFTQINLELGRLLLGQGRPREAVAILAPALRGALDASNLYVSRTELHESLAQAWDAAGERDSARVHWAAVAEAWERADPVFRARREVALRNR